jgi:RNA polymerase sigma factor (sigma-70 family)
VIPAFPDTRWSLIARLPGEPGQAMVLVELYAEAVASYLRTRLAGEAEPARIDDAVQEALVELLERPGLLARARPQPGGRFRWYLMTVAWHAAMNALRRERRATAHLLPDHIDLPAPEQRVAMDRAWIQALVAAALAELRSRAADGQFDPEAVAVLEANLLRGEPLRAVAQARGLSLATCQRRLALGRTLLAAALSERLRLAGDPDEADQLTAACLAGAEPAPASGG